MNTSDKVTIVVDAMGGDNAPQVVIEGIAQALQEDENLEVIVTGLAEIVEPFAAEHERCTAHATTEVIEMADHPAEAVRKKKDSSIVVGCRLVKEGEAQGFFSAGSTGACLAAGTLIMGRIKGITRPCLCSVLPSPVKPVVMADIGANADCKPEYLVQFAQMASIYAEKIVNITNPSVALLNIGSEDTKGNQFSLAAFDLLKEKVPNFVGNGEGTDVLTAHYDIFVCDGFTGNVVLKTIEGTSKTLFSSLKDIFFKNIITKLAALVLKGGMKELKDHVSPDTYGGAPLLGVKGACIVGHGSSNAVAVKNGIKMTARMARVHINELIAETVSK